MISEAGTSRLQYGSRRQNPAPAPAPAPALCRPAAGTTAAVTAQPEPARCIDLASLHFRRLSAAGCAAGGRNCRSRPAGGPLLQCYLGLEENIASAIEAGRLLRTLGCIFFLHNFSGMKQMCWTTGSWWCCLRVEVVSLIPAGSMIIHQFLCGFIYVFPLPEHQH